MAENPLVLLVDDNSGNIQLLANTLKALECDLAYCDNPQDVINQVKLILPDLILMDIVMPIIDGYQLCAQIKTSPGIDHIPIIFQTAVNNKESLVRAFKTGGIDYITKPYNMDELKERISSNLKLETIITKKDGFKHET